MGSVVKHQTICHQEQDPQRPTPHDYVKNALLLIELLKTENGLPPLKDYGKMARRRPPCVTSVLRQMIRILPPTSSNS